MHCSLVFLFSVKSLVPKRELDKIQNVILKKKKVAEINNIKKGQVK